MNSTNTKKTEKGFSLIELLVSLVIFIIVSGSMYGLLMLGSVNKNRSSRRTDVLKNARAAIHLIGRDALNAGLGYHRSGAMVPDDFIATTLGVPTDADTDRDILTSVIAGNNLFGNDLQDFSDPGTDIIAFAFRDLEFNSGDAISIDESLAGSAANVLRLKTNSPSTTSPLGINDLVLVEADTTQVAVLVSSIIDIENLDISNTDPLGINLPANGAGANRNLLVQCSQTITDNCTENISSLKRFTWVSYKVKQDGTLVRITYGNNGTSTQQIQERPLAYNVKDLQFSYVLENGVVTEDPGAGPDQIAGTADDTPGDFNLIRQINVTIEVQSTVNDDVTGKPESIRLSGSFSARNLEYDVG